jgi:hypothetical protein
MTNLDTITFAGFSPGVADGGQLPCSEPAPIRLDLNALSPC